jgi:hypothetical protein
LGLPMNLDVVELASQIAADLGVLAAPFPV